jgi:hypothetical protein
MDLDVSIIHEMLSRSIAHLSGISRLKWRLAKVLFLLNRYLISTLIMYATSSYVHAGQFLTKLFGQRTDS